jgi:hypothetical protein
LVAIAIEISHRYIVTSGTEVHRIAEIAIAVAK